MTTTRGLPPETSGAESTTTRPHGPERTSLAASPVYQIGTALCNNAAIRQKEIERMDAQQARAKMADLFGHGWQGDFSEATGIHRVSLSKQLIGDRIPDSIAGHIEWLCATPPGKWPERWQKLAARAKANAAKQKAA
jgi:hypothetical protein